MTTPATENTGGARGVRLNVVVEDVALRRDDESGLPALFWQLRREQPDEGVPVIWRRQVFRPESLDAIRRDLALFDIVCAPEDAAGHLVKAKGCKLEIEAAGQRVEFVRRLDSNVYAGEVGEQRVAEEMPL